VVNTVEPLLGNWLQASMTDNESLEFQSIRINALPEIILAYITVLNFGGHVISREILLNIMNLATQIAARESLTNCFIGSGRMAELVDSLAIASKSMIRAEEAGRKQKKGGSKRLVRGESMELWHVKISRDQADETESYS